MKTRVFPKKQTQTFLAAEERERERDASNTRNAPIVKNYCVVVSHENSSQSSASMSSLRARSRML